MTDRNDELGALWLRKSKAGKKYMSGRIDVGGQKIDVVVFKNEHKKEGERTPDYRIYRSQPRQESGLGEPRQEYSDMDDEIPF